MPSLDKHGDLAVATLVFYIPILLFAILLALRHGFSRSAGWVTLIIFALLRIIGSAFMIAAQLKSPVDESLYTAAFICDSAGISPLEITTVAFLSFVTQNTPMDTPRMNTIYRLLRLGMVVGLVLSIIGGSQSTSSNTNTQHQAVTLRHAGIIVLAVLYVVLIGIHALLWTSYSYIMVHRRVLLKAITAALPFFAVRIIYSILSVYSSDGSMVVSTNHSLAKFNLLTGEWGIYLVMALIMEYIVVVIYMAAGAAIPLGRDYAVDGPKSGESIEMRYPTVV